MNGAPYDLSSTAKDNESSRCILTVTLLNVGKKIESAKTDYESAMKKLSTGNGNLIRSTDKLRQLGAKPKKSLPAQLREGAIVEGSDIKFTENNNENDK